MLVGCSSATPSTTDSGDGEEVGSSSQALTAVQARVLGFEAPTQDWHSSNGSSVTSSTVVSQGSAALAVVPNGYTEVISTPISAPGGALATATVDVRLSQALNWGEARLVMRAPSASLWWSDLGVRRSVTKQAGEGALAVVTQHSHRFGRQLVEPLSTTSALQYQADSRSLLV